MKRDTFNKGVNISFYTEQHWHILNGKYSGQTQGRVVFCSLRARGDTMSTQRISPCL